MTNNLHKNVQGDKISLENWRTHPYNRIAFSKVDKILPYEVIHKGTKKISFILKSKIFLHSSFQINTMKNKL